MFQISDSDFQRIVTFIKQGYGIDLSRKRPLIEGRLSGYIYSLGYSDFHTYAEDLFSKKNAKDIEEMLNRLTTNYTYFLREENHFDYFRNTVLPWLEHCHKHDRSLSIWSAGCSTGQEPYTLSILLKEYFGSKADKWDTRILATDISQKVLGVAQKGVYDEESLQKLPPSWLSKYFRKSATEGMYEVAPSLRSNVIFRTFNLMEPITFRRKFDVIFCRNVMIYFDQPTKDALVNRFYDYTVPGGYLFIGHSESLNKAATSYEYLLPATYRKKGFEKK